MARHAVAVGHRPGHGPSFADSLQQRVCGGGSRKHQLRHAHAVEMVRQGVPLPVIQSQPVHAHLGVTSAYMQGIDTAESSTRSTRGVHR
jgi:integrase